MHFLLRALTRVPLPVLYALGWLAYFVSFEILRWRRDLARANLRGAFPEKSGPEIESILRKSYRNLGTLIAEAIHGFGAGKEEIMRRVRAENPELPLRYFNEGHSVVLVTGHFCNWEWLLSGTAAALGVPIDAVYKPQRLAAVDRFLREARGRFGSNPIPVKTFLHEVVRRRRDARVFGLVADQTPMAQEDKHWTVFLHRDTAFYTGAGKIARIVRAPVIFVAMQRVRRGYYTLRFQLLAEPPYAGAGERAVIEAYARALEAEIRTSPADWLWVHRKWKYPKPASEAAAPHSATEERPVQQP